MLREIHSPGMTPSGMTQDTHKFLKRCAKFINTIPEKNYSEGASFPRNDIANGLGWISVSGIPGAERDFEIDGRGRYEYRIFRKDNRVPDVYYNFMFATYDSDFCGMDGTAKGCAARILLVADWKGTEKEFEDFLHTQKRAAMSGIYSHKNKNAKDSDIAKTLKIIADEKTRRAEQERKYAEEYANRRKCKNCGEDWGGDDNENEE